MKEVIVIFFLVLCTSCDRYFTAIGTVVNKKTYQLFSKLDIYKRDSLIHWLGRTNQNGKFNISTITGNRCTLDIYFSHEKYQTQRVKIHLGINDTIFLMPILK